MTKPAIAARPILLPPSSKASGIIDSASMTSIAPAANDMAIDIIAGLVFDSTAKPIAVDIVPITTAIDHKKRIYFLLLPLAFIPCVEAKPSGKFEMNIAAISTTFTAPPVTREIPKAIFSGILSMIDPTSKDNPDVLLPPPEFSPWDLFLSLTELSSLDFLSRMRFAALYDIPPRINPIATDGIDCDRLKASSIRENDNAATSTPLPKAIIAAIILFGRLTNNATTDPMISGMLATKPQIRDSHTV